MLPWVIVWVAVLIIAGIVEALTTALTAIWFMPAAIVSLILSFFEVNYWVQILVFAVVSLLGVLAFRPLVKKYWTPKGQNFNVDALIGQKCVVTSRIENIAGNGEVKINGLYWAARAADEEKIYEVGDVVTVIAIEGVKLICK